MIRLYDINTLQCYISPNADGNHLGPINQVRTSQKKKILNYSKLSQPVKVLVHESQS